jgi:uncharacterized membrane protein YhaH (DUF805 family)
MAGFFSAGNLRFLFRTDRGRIGRSAWWAGVGLLAMPSILLTMGWLLIAPYADRTLDERALIDPLTLIAYVYLVVYAFAAIFIAVCFVMLSMKRLRERARPPALAGLPPLVALIVGATHWLQPRVAEVMGRGWVYAADALLAAVIVWAIYEMGMAEISRR